MDTSNANQHYLTPQEGINSSKYRRARRKTALELCFGEELVFSDSEDEAQYSHQASIHIAETLLVNGSTYNTLISNINESNKLSSSVKDQILEICCDHCKCCKNIKGILNTSPEVDFPLTSSSASYNNDFRPFKGYISTQNPKILNKMIVRPPMPLMEIDFNQNADLNNGVISGVEEELNIKYKGKEKKRTTSSRKMQMKTKPVTIVEEKKSSPNLTEDISENRLKNISSPLGSSKNDENPVKKKKSNILRANNENISTSLRNKKKSSNINKVRKIKATETQKNKKRKLNPNGNTTNDVKNFEVTKATGTLSDGLNRQDNLNATDSSENDKSTVKKKKIHISIANHENINTSSHCVNNISTWTLRNKKKSCNINKVRKIEATETQNDKKRKLNQNENITNIIKSFKVTKATGALSGGLNLQDNLIATETDSFHLKGKRTSRTNYLKQNYIQSIDKPLFKIPVDTTNDRSYTKAVARKLARTGGLRFSVDSLNLTINDCRTCQIPKLRNLYSSDEWLNSDEFLTLRFSNLRKTL